MSEDPTSATRDARPDGPEVLSRRRMLSRVSLAMSGMIAAVLSVPIWPTCSAR